MTDSIGKETNILPQFILDSALFRVCSVIPYIG